jgi:hypothetical protein
MADTLQPIRRLRRQAVGAYFAQQKAGEKKTNPNKDQRTKDYLGTGHIIALLGQMLTTNFQQLYHLMVVIVFKGIH